MSSKKGKRKKRKPAEKQRRAPREPWKWLLAGVILLAAAVGAVHLLVGIQLVDEGVLNMGAWRISLHQVPYRDFFLFCTPFSFYLVAAVYKLFGATILAGRLLAMALGFIFVAVTARLSTRLIPSKLFAALPVAVLCQAGFGIWPFASHHWIANIFCILAVLCALRALSKRPLLWSTLAGLYAAGAFWTLNDQGAFFILVATFLYIPFVPRGVRGKTASGWILGGATASLPFLAVLLTQVKLSTLWYDFFVFPFTGYKAIAGNRYGLFFPLKEIAAQWSSGAWREAPFYTPVASLTSLVIYLAPIAAVVLVGVSYWKKWADAPRRGLLAAGVFSLVAAAARRWAPINLQWAAVFPFIMVAWSLWFWYDSSRKKRWIPAGIAVLLIVCYGFFGLYSIGKVLAPGDIYPVKGNAGTLYTFEKEKAAKLQSVINQIQSRLKPGEPLLCKTAPLINFFTLHPNPTPIDFFRPPDYTTESQTREVISDLDLKKVEWIMTPAFVPTKNTFDRYLLSHYSLTWNNGEYGLWHRNPPDTVSALDHTVERKAGIR